MSLARMRELGAALGAQAAASGCSLILTIVAAHRLGPNGLGAIAIGFTIYLAALGLQRALITEPLVSSVGRLSDESWRRTVADGVSLSITWASAATAALTAFTILIAPDHVTAIVPLTLWLLPALCQDILRSVLFAEGERFGGFASSAAWLVTMAALLPWVLPSRSVWSIASMWGVGSVAGAAVAVAFHRTRPSALKAALRTWNTELRPLGRWLALESVIFQVGTIAITLLIASLDGTEGLGALRAVQSVFMPLTVITPSLVLFGLPVISRNFHRDVRDGRRAAVQISLVAVCLSVGYMACVLPFFSLALAIVGGNEFDNFAYLAPIVGLAQIPLALGIGATLLARVADHGSSLVLARIASMSLSLLALPLLNEAYGLAGAAWALVAGSALGTAYVAWVAFRIIPDAKALAYLRT